MISKKRVMFHQDKRLTQDFSENENQDHSDVKTGLLSSSTDTGVTDNTNSKTESVC